MPAGGWELQNKGGHFANNFWDPFNSFIEFCVDYRLNRLYITVVLERCRAS